MSCQTCTTPIPTTPHYRLSRANQGTTHPHSTIHLCDTCRTRAQTLLGEQLGWTVKRGNDPALIPWFRLTDQKWLQWNGEGFVVINSTLAVELQVAFGQISSGAPA
jgi:hypothetical protein